MAPSWQSNTPLHSAFEHSSPAPSTATDAPDNDSIDSSINLSFLLVVIIFAIVMGWSLKLCLKRFCTRKEQEGNVVLMLHLHSLREECLVLELFRTFECPSMVNFAPTEQPRGFSVHGFLWPRLVFTCRNHVVSFKRTGVREEVPTRVKLGPLQALVVRRMLRTDRDRLQLHYEWRHNGNAFLVPLATETFSRASGNPPIVD